MNGITADPVESANHEAFHFWKYDEARTLYVDTLLDNIDFVSKAAADFLGKIEQGYLGETIDVDDDRTNIVLEEALAYLTGFAQSGDLQNIAHEVLRDYDAVKAAWDTLVETQTQNVAAAEGKTDIRDSIKPDIQYSLADEAAEDAGKEKLEVDAPEAKSDLRSSMPRKAAEMLKRTERELLWAIERKGCS